MKTAAVLLVILGLAFIGFAGDVPSVNELTEILSRGPWAELPMRAVAAVRHAKATERKETTIAVVKAVLGLNPASATAIVGAIARAIPAMTAVAAETAAAEQPKQAPEIALAAAAADHSAAAAIVAGMCRAVPAQYESIAVAVDTAVPGSGKEILDAVGTAEPDLKLPISQVVAQYTGYMPSVGMILAQAKPGATSEGSDIATPNFRPDRPTATNYHRVDKSPIPIGGFGGEPPFKYHRP